jgi:hypothetical protein
MAAVADRPLPLVMVSGLKAGLDMALWGRNLKPVVDPEPIIVAFCRQMRQNFTDHGLLTAKLDRVCFLREGLFS